jgi:hypothetical protein
MKFETLMLKSLFVACVLAGALTIGSMLLSTTATPSVVSTHVVGTAHSAN